MKEQVAEQPKPRHIAFFFTSELLMSRIAGIRTNADQRECKQIQRQHHHCNKQIAPGLLKAQHCWSMNVNEDKEHPNDPHQIVQNFLQPGQAPKNLHCEFDHISQLLG
jgi:hypothetical protein